MREWVKGKTEVEERDNHDLLDAKGSNEIDTNLEKEAILADRDIKVNGTIIENENEDKNNLVSEAGWDKTNNYDDLTRKGVEEQEKGNLSSRTSWGLKTDVEDKKVNNENHLCFPELHTESL